MTDEGNRARIIANLLAKAQAKGATPQESEAYTAKATELMIKWRIEEAMLQDSGRVAVERIVEQRFKIVDIPKTYTHEYVMIGVSIAKPLGVRAIIGSANPPYLILVGFESDVKRAGELYASLVVQCTMQLGPWYRANLRTWWNGTERYRAKRGFISGFGRGAGDKLSAILRIVESSSGPGTDLILVDRSQRVDGWLSENMQTRTTPGRKQDSSSALGGWRAGQQADLGQTAAGNGGQRAVTR